MQLTLNIIHDPGNIIKQTNITQTECGIIFVNITGYNSYFSEAWCDEYTTADFASFTSDHVECTNIATVHITGDDFDINDYLRYDRYTSPYGYEFVLVPKDITKIYQ